MLCRAAVKKNAENVRQVLALAAAQSMYFSDAIFVASTGVGEVTLSSKLSTK